MCRNMSSLRKTKLLAKLSRLSPSPYAYTLHDINWHIGTLIMYVNNVDNLEQVGLDHKFLDTLELITDSITYYDLIARLDQPEFAITATIVDDLFTPQPLTMAQVAAVTNVVGRTMRCDYTSKSTEVKEMWVKGLFDVPMGDGSYPDFGFLPDMTEESFTRTLAEDKTFVRILTTLALNLNYVEIMETMLKVSPPHQKKSDKLNIGSARQQVDQGKTIGRGEASPMFTFDDYGYMSGLNPCMHPYLTQRDPSIDTDRCVEIHGRHNMPTDNVVEHGGPTGRLPYGNISIIDMCKPSTTPKWKGDMHRTTHQKMNPYVQEEYFGQNTTVQHIRTTTVDDVMVQTRMLEIKTVLDNIAVDVGLWGTPGSSVELIILLINISAERTIDTPFMVTNRIVDATRVVKSFAANVAYSILLTRLAVRVSLEDVMKTVSTTGFLEKVPTGQNRPMNNTVYNQGCGYDEWNRQNHSKPYAENNNQQQHKVWGAQNQHMPYQFCGQPNASSVPTLDEMLVIKEVLDKYVYQVGDRPGGNASFELVSTLVKLVPPQEIQRNIQFLGDNIFIDQLIQTVPPERLYNVLLTRLAGMTSYEEVLDIVELPMFKLKISEEEKTNTTEADKFPGAMNPAEYNMLAVKLANNDIPGRNELEPPEDGLVRAMMVVVRPITKMQTAFGYPDTTFIEQGYTGFHNNMMTDNGNLYNRLLTLYIHLYGLQSLRVKIREIWESNNTLPVGNFDGDTINMDIPDQVDLGVEEVSENPTEVKDVLAEEDVSPELEHWHKQNKHTADLMEEEINNRNHVDNPEVNSFNDTSVENEVGVSQQKLDTVVEVLRGMSPVPYLVEQDLHLEIMSTLVKVGEPITYSVYDSEFDWDFDIRRILQILTMSKGYDILITRLCRDLTVEEIIQKISGQPRINTRFDNMLKGYRSTGVKPSEMCAYIVLLSRYEIQQGIHNLDEHAKVKQLLKDIDGTPQTPVLYFPNINHYTGHLPDQFWKHNLFKYTILINLLYKKVSLVELEKMLQQDYKVKLR